MAKRFSIAVDFDGTLCENRFPKIGYPKYHVINQLIRIKSKYGDKVRLILWTCREDTETGYYLSDAIAWCKKQGLVFDFINENPIDDEGFIIAHPRKFYADLIIDDHSISPESFSMYPDSILDREILHRIEG